MFLITPSVISRKTIPQISLNGRKQLGLLIKNKRGKRSLDDIVELIKEKTGLTLAKSTLSHLENGHCEPTINTLLVLSYSVLSDYSINDLIEMLILESH